MATEHSVQSLKVYKFPCCGTILCWINRRVPNYCPECGQKVFVQLKTDPACVLVRDDNATVSFRTA